MTSRIDVMAIDCHNTRLLADFWTRVLGWKVIEVEIARLESLGAHRIDIGQDPSVTWTVLADPEGNEFCILGKTWQEAH